MLPGAVALAVIVLPLNPAGTISVKQSAGITFQLREAIERGAFAKLLSESADDARQSTKCELDLACLLALAKLRGADVIVAGTVAPAADGLTLNIVAVGPDIQGGARTFERKIHGDEEDERAFDRLVREAVDPRALLGSIFIEGEEGAHAYLDGEDLGALPLHAQRNGVVEGDHSVTVKRGDVVLWDRKEHVVFAETTMVRAMSIDDATPPSKPLPIAPLAIGAAGGALIVAGAVCGTFSLLASMETEARAKEQQLVFPRDEGLLFRGQALAWTADALYVAGGAALIGATVMFVAAE